MQNDIDYGLFDLMRFQGHTDQELQDYFHLDSLELSQMKRTIRRKPGRPEKVPVRGGRTVCPVCKEIKPLTAEHFHKRTATSRGFATTCKLCLAVPKARQGSVDPSEARFVADVSYYYGRLDQIGFEEFDKQYTRQLHRTRAMKKVRDNHIENEQKMAELQAMMED